jgi:hypothetical protein
MRSVAERAADSQGMLDPDPRATQALPGIPALPVHMALRGLRLPPDKAGLQDQRLGDWARRDLGELAFPFAERGSQRVNLSIDLSIVRATEITLAAPAIGIGIEITGITTAGGVRGVAACLATDIRDGMRPHIRM